MTHLSPSIWIHTTSKCSNKSPCLQTKAPREKLCFCFEMKILPFSGILSEVRSIVEITKGVQSKILNHKFLKLWTYQPPPPPPLSLSLSLSRSLHAVLTSRVYCFFVFLFRYSLISIHSVKKNSTWTAVGVILNTLWWNAPMFYHLWCQTNAALMRTSTNNPLFSSNNLTDSCASHLVRGKHSCSVTHHSTWSAIPLCTAACEITCKYISMTFTCNGCLSKLCHDGCDGRESGDQTEMH